MADLLYKKIAFIIAFAFLFTGSANAYESSFPFPFEFGHSSDIYLDVQKKETKQDRQIKQDVIDVLNERGIKTSPKDFVKYIKKGDIGVIKLMLDAGFDPNTNINSNFPLYYSTKYNKREITRILLEKGADPNKDFTSPLRYAILHKDYDCAKILIEHGADVNYIDIFTGETLLYTALKKRQYDITVMLLNKGAHVDNASYKKIKTGKLERKLGISLN